MASAPEGRSIDRRVLELLIGVGADGAGPHLTLERGHLVDVEGPTGTFAFPARPAERHFVFVAGGTGIAPLRAMLRHAVLGSIAADRLGLLYSARSPGESEFIDEFRELASRSRLDFRQTITRDTEHDWTGARAGMIAGVVGAGSAPGDAVLRLRTVGDGRGDAAPAAGSRHDRNRIQSRSGERGYRPTTWESGVTIMIEPVIARPPLPSRNTAMAASSL